MKRNWEPKDIDKAFFDVGLKDLQVFIGKEWQKVKGYRAVVNFDDEEVISIVTNKYHLVTNLEAYNIADHVVKVLFPGASLNDFECYNLVMSQSKGSCRMDLIIPSSKESPFGDESDPWTPFVRISNSYNRKIKLHYEIGFCRWICLNGVIFNQKGIDVSLNHSTKISKDKIIDQIRQQAIELKSVRGMWNELKRKLNILREIEMTSSMALPMFCRAFNVKIDKKTIKERKKNELRAKAKLIKKLSEDYFKEMGNNAYAIFNVLTDYATYPDYAPNTYTTIHSNQRTVGNWADELIKKSSNNNFSMSEFIGGTAQDNAYYMESLIENENK